MPAVQEIRVTYRKYDGALHWNHGAQLLGEDRHGVWVGVGPTIPVFRGAEAFGPPEAPFVILMPHEAWWTAMFNAAPHRTALPPIYNQYTRMAAQSRAASRAEPRSASSKGS